MGWVRPAIHEDPDDHWRDDENAYDGDVATFATPRGRDEMGYTTWLGFWLEPVRSTEVRVWLDIPAPSCGYYVDVYDGENWRGTGWLSAHPGQDWHRFTFDAQIVEAVWVNLHPDAEAESLGGIGDVVIGTGCTGPLAPICEIIHAVGDWFDGLADDIEGVMFVGGALSTPFRNLGEKFRNLGDTCCEVSADLQDILDALESGITWEKISAIIAEHWPGLALLLDDPAEWLTQLLLEHAPGLYYLIVDPGGELLYLIAQLFDLTPYEAQNGEMVVKALFERYFPTLYLLWRDPEHWLEEHVDPRIAAVLGEIADFMADPWGWLLDKLEDGFEDISERVQYVAEHAIRFLWEGEW